MKRYDILEAGDFSAFINKIDNYILENKLNDRPFKKLSITVKSYRKDKTPQQHKYYWAVINQMVKAFHSVGYEFNQEQCHEFVKKSHGYTESATLKNGETIHVTKSIADHSENVNVKVMADLIDFAIRWTAQNLDYIIQDPRRERHEYS